MENPVNPFTGNSIVNSSEIDEEHYVIVSWDWDVSLNNGNQFLPAQWATVSENVNDANNWVFYTDKTTLPPGLK